MERKIEINLIKFSLNPFTGETMSIHNSHKELLRNPLIPSCVHVMYNFYTTIERAAISLIP